MPNDSHIAEVARQLDERLNGDDFLTLDRFEITGILRDVSGEPTTRIKMMIGETLTEELDALGVLVQPGLTDTTTGDTVRLCRAGSTLAKVTRLVMHPNEGSDAELARILAKESKGSISPVIGAVVAAGLVATAAIWAARARRRSQTDE